MNWSEYLEGVMIKLSLLAFLLRFLAQLFRPFRGITIKNQRPCRIGLRRTDGRTDGQRALSPLNIYVTYDYQRHVLFNRSLFFFLVRKVRRSLLVRRRP